MSATDERFAQVAAATAAYTAAYLVVEGTLPTASVGEVEGLPYIRYDRPKGGVAHEVIAGYAAPETVLAIVGRHPELTDAFVSMFTTPENAAEPAMNAAGYERAVHNFVMRCDVRAEHGARADATVVRFTTPEQIEQLAALREDDQLRPEYLNNPAVRCYALVIDDIPAASALLISPGHDIAMIEYVHTLETYRRRGYGRWLMRALHREAANLGAQAVVLGSNDSGRPLYEALGYELLCYEDVYRR